MFDSITRFARFNTEMNMHTRTTSEGDMRYLTRLRRKVYIEWYDYKYDFEQDYDLAECYTTINSGSEIPWNSNTG